MKLSATIKEAVADAKFEVPQEDVAKASPRLPDLERAKTAVLNSLTSASGQRTYDHAMREFVATTFIGSERHRRFHEVRRATISRR